MSEQPDSIEIKTTGPAYLGWRGELLAELALAHVPGFVVHKRPGRSESDLPYDFLVATDDGVCFFVEVKAFSSARLGRQDVAEIPELRWAVDAELVEQARESQSPFILFLFDADSDHGRFLRIDTWPATNEGTRRITLRFPVQNTISRESLERLVHALQAPSAA